MPWSIATSPLLYGIDTKPDAAAQIDIDGWFSYRNVDSLKNGYSNLSAINIHESVLERIKAVKDEYVINPKLQMLRPDVAQVVTSADNVSRGDTEQLRRLVANSIKP